MVQSKQTKNHIRHTKADETVILTQKRNFFVLLEYIPGFDEIWILGHDFASRSCDEYFKKACNTNEG